MNSDFMQEYTVEQMRLQRHDFMNYLQVIYGYIQINRPQEAVNYIKGINKKMVVLSQLFNLECSNFALLMQDLIINFNKFGIDVDFNTEIESISCDIFSKNIVEKSKLFNNIKDIILNNRKNENNRVYINVSEENGRIKILFSFKEQFCLEDYDMSNPTVIVNNQELGHEINCYESLDNSIIIFDIY